MKSMAVSRNQSESGFSTMSAAVEPSQTSMRAPRARWLSAVAAALVAFAALADPAPVSTTVLGPFVGTGAALDPANESPQHIAFYGTDLGFSYAHAGRLHFLFGDTSAIETGEPIQASTAGRFDDSFGSLELSAWPDPAQFTAGHLPRVRLGQNPGTTETAALDPGFPMELFKTPVGGFSNGQREFGLFYLAKPVACANDADCGGLACDTGLGFAGSAPAVQEGFTLACSEGAPGCVADTMMDTAGKPRPGTGICVDRTVSIWRDDAYGRASSAAVTLRVAVRDLDDPRRYKPLRDWATIKFSNIALRTVQDFVPERGAGRAQQDYRTAGSEGEHRRVFLWGRPGFMGVGARGRTLGLYFGYVDLPENADSPWKIQYFTGLDSQGVPQFGEREVDAVAVDLDAALPGVQPEEARDVVNQVSIAWAEPLGKWVMLYSGGVTRLPLPPVLPNCGVLELFTGAYCRDVVIGDGAVSMRTAADPWGPWSAPREVLVGGDPDARPLTGQYAAGGMLRHAACQGANCAPHTPDRNAQPNEYGFLYSPNIIEQWIRPAGKGVDIIWNASTWDPYRVILLRTRIE